MEYNHSENFFQNIPIDKNRKADFSMPFHFPAKIYETDLGRKPFGTNAWHWHDELQFCIVTSGSLCVTVCQQKYELQSGEGIFINSGCIHMTMSRSKDPAQYLCLNIHPQMFSFFHGSAMEQKYFLPFLGNSSLPAVILRSSSFWQKEILLLERKLPRLFREQEKGYELEIYIILIQMWKLLVLHADLPAGVPSDGLEKQEEVKQILKYIHKNYGRRILLEELAGTVHLSREACCRLFRRALNCTIFDYIIEYRIRRSMELLEHTSLSVTQIAYNTGFSSTSYYIRTFRQRVHMTPGAYRRKAALLHRQ